MKQTNKFLIAILLVFSSINIFANDFGIKMNSISKDSTIVSKKKVKAKKANDYIEGASAKGNFVFQPTLNFGHHIGFRKIYSSYGYGYSYSGLIPGVTLNLDYNVHKYGSVGVYYSVAFQSYSVSKVFYLGNAFGVRGIFHWWQLLSDKSSKELLASKIDFDLHFHTGGFYVSEKNKISGEKLKHLGFNAGGGLGFKYYFVKNFGVAFDVGYEEFSWMKLGLAFKV